METLTDDGIEYSYVVRSVDIETATMIVEYTPTDPLLMPVSLNVLFVEHREWSLDPQTGQQIEVGTDKTFEQHRTYSIKQGAPVQVWRRQKLLLQNN